MDKKLLYSLSKAKGDFVVETFRCGGSGGQNINKVETGVRIIHPKSGAIGMSRDERSQAQNRKKAFIRLTKSKKFIDWKRIYDAYILQGVRNVEREIERKVNELMKEENLKIEYYDPNSNRRN